MRSTTIWLFLGLVCCLIGWSAFQSKAPSSRAELVAAEVNKRVADYRSKRLKRCQDKILKRATELADSVLIDRARSMTIDTFQKPPIPARPEIPEVPIIEDTLIVAPLLTIDSLLDTNAIKQ